MPTLQPPPAVAARICRGSRADLDALIQQHYRTAPPVAVERVLVALDTSTGELVGGLAASRPPLNDSWRGRAWPDLFPSGLSPRQRAARLNDHVRILSRVVVVPSRRSLSIATHLVRHYLLDPITPCTEALAAMGDIAPFFERAGMRRLPLPVTRRDHVLVGALAEAGVTPLDLAGLDAHPPPIPALVVGALRTWARAHRATRPRAESDPITLGLCAAASLLAPRAAYTARLAGA